MNFYEHQDRAERRTKLIVFLFVLAVLCIVSIVAVPVGFATEWKPEPIIVTVVVCLLIVGIATIVKLRQLRGGGQVVAEMMGGTQLQQGGLSKSERRVQNIVEEMAIASGMPVPPVYIMEDDSINAFAAGWTPGNAVIGVTRGCIEKLSRDELQGVIAHEYSHISHGDMRMNIRLIGVIFGIMVLGVTGWVMVRYIGPMVLHSSSRSRSKEGAGGAGVGLAIIVLGLFLSLCGCVGTFFGRLIQAGVSRQREFLADASAVQYTRNPSGIGGALRKIGGITPISKTPSDASQCNHMFFSQAMKAMFASHPPVAQRIARIEGIDVSSLPQTDATEASVGLVSSFSSSTVIDSIDAAGAVQENYQVKARSAIDGIHPTVLSSIRDPWSSRLVMYSLLIDANDEDQQKILAQNLSIEELAELKKITPLISKSNGRVRLPLIDLAAPALRQLSDSQKQAFADIVFVLVKSDGVVDMFEWVFVAVLQSHLFGVKRHKQNGVLRTMLPSVCVVVGGLAHCGANSQDGALQAFNTSVSELGFAQIEMPIKTHCSVGSIERAIQELSLLRFTEKERLLKACVTCVTHDGNITTNEAETIRAIGDLLDCPIPMY